jgi:hypothetical protein
MMLVNDKTRILFCAIAALFIVAFAGSASAEIAIQKNAELTRELSDFKRVALEMRREADVLSSFTPQRQLSWQSHASRLNTLRDHVNELGESLAQLEAMKPVANETQTQAIDHARPHLVSVAKNLTEAIELVNEDRRNVYWGDYGEAVSDVYSQADALHGKLDAILDYEKAKTRLETLELQLESIGRS